MTITHVFLAFALLAPISDGAFQTDAVRVVSATRNHLNAPSETVRLNTEQSERVRQTLMQGTREPAVFMADYSVRIVYRHKREFVLVNGSHFKFEGRTYVTRDDLGSILAALWGSPPKQH